LVGALGCTVGGNTAQGVVYVFVQNSDGSWGQQAELTASDGAAYDNFGASVAVEGATLVAGAPGHGHQGAAYIFAQNNGAWGQQVELTASDATAGSDFGDSVAISGTTVLVGACSQGPNFQQGAAYLFGEDGGTWVQQAELIASDGAEYDLFGYSVAISGNIALVGAYYHQVGANRDQGAAYVFSDLSSSTTTTLVSSANPSVAGQPVTFTTTVTGQSPTGTVSFSKNGAILATASLANGQASYTYTFTLTGTKSITATYSGDANNQSSNAMLNQVVGVTGSNPTSTTLSASSNPVTAGQSITLTAIVTGQSPTGTITFIKNGATLATVPVANGQATYTQAYDWANTKSIYAEYSGDIINQASISSLLDLVINPATSTTTLVSSENPANLGDSVMFTATVTSSSGLTPPDGGLVTFTQNGNVIATVPLAGGQASYTAVFEVANTKSMVASYAGDVTNQGST
jgi:hypothetical protein